MIGFILLLIAIFLYFRPKYRYLSYFLYLSFMMGVGGGFGLWTDDILGCKNMDLAIIYTFVISVILLSNKQYKIPRWSFVTQYKWLMAFMFVSILFSSFYYHFSPYQILQGGRSFLLIFSFPILVNIQKKIFEKVFKLLLKVCILTSFLYILQIVTRTALMPYGDFSIDDATGLPRFYNFPANLDVFLALTFLKPELFGKRVNLYRVLFFVALICTLGRTMIMTSILLIFLALLFDGKVKKIGSALIIIALLFLPLMDTVSSRFSNGGTSDFEDIKAGNFKEGYVQGRDQGTMLYRFAWVYERYEYMTHRPLCEQLFGLGLISDSQPWVDRHYQFNIGLMNPSHTGAVQLTTPDISYGNLLTKLGFLGSVIYIIFVLALILFSYKKRKENVFLLLTSASLLMLLINSFSGSAMSETRTLSIYFLFLSTLIFKQKKNESCTYRIRVGQSNA